MTCQPTPSAIMQNLVRAGLMEPCVVLDGECREIRAYRPTAKGRRWFGDERQTHTIIAESTPVPVGTIPSTKRDQAAVRDGTGVVLIQTEAE